MSDLDQGLPCVRSELFLAVITLGINLLKLCLEGLLYGHSFIDLFFDLDLEVNSLGVFLRPCEVGFKQFELLQASQFLQAHSE